MALLLRKIEKRRWDWIETPPPWLTAGEVPAAPFWDLRTNPDSCLSVWHIQDDRSNLDRILAALAAKRDHIDKFDYSILDEGFLRAALIQVVPSPGDTKDQVANASWHRHLVELSGSKLITVISLIRESGNRARLLEKQVRELIRTAVNSVWINKADLPPTIQTAILAR